MSIQDAVILSELQRASFGTAPVAIVASLPLLERVVSCHLAHAWRCEADIYLSLPPQ